MKKTLVLSAIMALVAIGAQAALVQGLGYELNTGYDGQDLRESDLGYYSLYSLSSAKLSQVTGIAEANLTAANVTKWINEVAFFSGKSAIIKESKVWTIDTTRGVDMAKVSGGGTPYLRAALYDDTSITDNKWAILFYTHNGQQYFRIAGCTATAAPYDGKHTVGARGSEIGLAEGGYLFRGGSQAAFGAWTAVPEPTSGLLLLLGVAGLALKRKNKTV